MTEQKESDKNKIFENIESELLSTLFNYVVPFIGKKIRTTQKEASPKIKNLESMLNQKPKIDFKDLKELEQSLLKNLNKNLQSGKQSTFDMGNIFYSFGLSRGKTINRKADAGKFSSYSVFIKYEESQGEEKLSFSINKSGKDYSAEIVSKKAINDEVAPYAISISYKESYSKERLTISYEQQLKSYAKRHIESKQDTTNMVPLKWLNILPESVMGGVLGFTYLGENFMGRRADLTGKTARMVDIHESIHTPNEYETRILTEWIMSKEKPKYIK